MDRVVPHSAGRGYASSVMPRKARREWFSAATGVTTMSFTSQPAAPDTALADCSPSPVFGIDASIAPTSGTRGVLAISLPLRHAGRRLVRIAWECIGASNAPLLVVQGGISASRHVTASATHPEAGWWGEQVGAERAIDLARHRVFSIDWLGADGTLDVTLDPADQADAIAAALDALSLPRVAAFVGASYGAMVGLQFAARHGARLDRLIAISGAHRSHPQSTALRVIQRRIVRLGRSGAAVREALALARSLAVIGYRTADEFDARFDTAPQVDAQGCRFAVEDYFDAVGPRFVARFTPTAYLRLSESIDLQRIDPATIRVPVELVAVAQDQIVPRADIEALAATLAGEVRVHHIDSHYGHDAFLKEVTQIDAILRSALATEIAA
jgi:homoserine O-acetyltransferase/O-succinyltransferase